MSDIAIRLFEHECVRGRLKARLDRNADLLVVVDQPRFGAVRGHAPAPAKAFVEALGTRFRTFVVSEYNTSKRCDVCGAPLIKTRAHSVRYWRCPMAGGSMARNKHGKRRHSSEQNKDIIAARSMLIIALTLWSTGVRPIEFTPDAPAAVSKRRRKQPDSAREGEEGEAHESVEATSIDER
jgi:hypothetical protein